VKVAFYDRLSIDDMASYRELADIRVHSRFRPIRDYDYDLVLVTHTRIAGALRMPVVLVGTAGRRGRPTPSRLMRCAACKPGWRARSVRSQSWDEDRSRSSVLAGLGATGPLA
jgi:hypothetical protein